MDVLADAREVLDELGVHFENSASEAAAAAMLAASVHYPIRGAVTFRPHPRISRPAARLDAPAP
jgi:indolepyruvate ferredoxin oxidoreductase alpha subunit